MTDEIIFIMGLCLCGAAILGFIIVFAIYYIKGIKLASAFDKEYGAVSYEKAPKKKGGK